MHALLVNSEGPGKRGHIVSDTLFPMMFLGLPKLGNICCGHKMFLNKIRNIFCVRHKCCARGQTGKHLCRQQCVRNNVSSFARSLTFLRALYMLFLFLGQCLNVALLDLVAAVVSLLTSCNIQTPSNIQRRQMRLRKNVNYCIQILLFL